MQQHRSASTRAGQGHAWALVDPGARSGLAPFRAGPPTLGARPLGLPTARPGTSPPPVPAHRRPPGTAARWSIRYRRRVLVTDLLVIGVAAAAGALTLQSPLWPAAVLVVVWMVVLQLFRTRSPRRMAVGADEYKRVVGASGATAGILCAAAVLIGDGTLARPLLLMSLPVGLLGLMAGRWVWRTWLHRLRTRGVALSDVVVVGRPADVAYVTRQIARRSAVAYRVVGVVLDGPDTASGPDGLPVFHGTERVPDAVRRLGADAVIVAGPLGEDTSAIRTLGWALEPYGAELILVSSLVNVAGPRITMRPVEGLPLMHVEQPRFEGGRHVLKRGLDIVVSALALLAMLPLFAVIAVIIRRDSPGGVFFSQIRTGRWGEPFRMYKFRTMVATAEQDKAALAGQNEAAGPLFKITDDPRITRVGHFLRRHSLDELPQFWNVLRGDMSLVGPRPPLPEEVATYEGHTGRRLYIKPGLTGLWQISGRSNLDWEESVRLDLYYVENWSVTGDLMIMWRTFKVMVNPEGAY